MGNKDSQPAKKEGFWSQLFGPSKEEVWRLLSNEIGGKFEEPTFLKDSRVHVTYDPWTITLDSYAVRSGNTVLYYTRMRAPFRNYDQFRFTIYRRGFFSDLGKKFGMQDVVVGAEQFDRDFIIQGNSERKLRLLFESEKLRQLISAQPEISLSIQDDDGLFGKEFPSGVDQLRFEVNGLITDIERLKLLFDLFAETLDQLCKIGAASEDNPRVTL